MTEEIAPNMSIYLQHIWWTYPLFFHLQSPHVLPYIQESLSYSTVETIKKKYVKILLKLLKHMFSSDKFQQFEIVEISIFFLNKQRNLDAFLHVIKI